MFLTAILDYAEKMMFARLDFYTFLICCSGDLSDNESDEKPSVAICGGSICILTGLKGTHLFVNEDMTRSRATIDWEARTLKREGKIIDTWTRDVTIFVKVGENAVMSFVTPRTWKAFTHKL